MPTYDYVCPNCGYETEVVHSVHGAGPSTCPQCGGPLKKAISAPAVHFKGGGWARKERSIPGKPGRSETKDAGTTSSEPSEAGAAPAKPPAPEPAKKDAD
jgi:putative FmdB family regulatory protein